MGLAQLAAAFTLASIVSAALFTSITDISVTYLVNRDVYAVERAALEARSDICIATADDPAFPHDAWKTELNMAVPAGVDIDDLTYEHGPVVTRITAVISDATYRNQFAIQSRGVISGSNVEFVTDSIGRRPKLDGNHSLLSYIMWEERNKC